MTFFCYFLSGSESSSLSCQDLFVFLCLLSLSLNLHLSLSCLAVTFTLFLLYLSVSNFPPLPPSLQSCLYVSGCLPVRFSTHPFLSLMLFMQVPKYSLSLYDFARICLSIVFLHFLFLTLSIVLIPISLSLSLSLSLSPSFCSPISPRPHPV